MLLPSRTANEGVSAKDSRPLLQAQPTEAYTWYQIHSKRGNPPFPACWSASHIPVMALLTNQAGVLLGPLTETWTMPESCTYYHEQCAACDVAFRGQACASVAGDDEGRPEDNASCWPPVTSGVKEPEAPFYGWGFYSPGIVCPAGYTTACTAVHGENPDWEVQFKPRPGETAVGCCPE